jgi:hypothetical protein
MSNARAMIGLTICCCLLTVGVKAQSTTPIQTQVESVLDSWQSRAAARQGLLKLASESEVVNALGAIAESRKQPFGRRSHAIGLLATFKNGRSVKVLARVTDAAKPPYRCGAIQALAEIASKATLPVLVSKLDDHSVCMQTQSTDPARTSDVYVSDEAVRALEQITGQTFGQESSTGHRAIQPWKEWWAKQRQERGAKQNDHADTVDPAIGNLAGGPPFLPWFFLCFTTPWVPTLS